MIMNAHRNETEQLWNVLAIGVWENEGGASQASFTTSARNTPISISMKSASDGRSAPSRDKPFGEPATAARRSEPSGHGYRPRSSCRRC